MLDQKEGDMNAREPIRQNMVISEFCTAYLQSYKSDLSIYYSEYKQRQTRKSRIANEKI